MTTFKKLSPEKAARKKIQRAIQKAIRADKDSELAHMSAYDVFHMLQFGKGALSAQGEEVKDRLDRATANLADAREGLGNAVYELEKILALTR